MSEDWKSFPPEQYRKEVENLVHFNAKTVNSNAHLVGIRLDSGAALDLPYISLRTLLDSGLTFPLDYAEGGAAKGKIVKQVNMILADTPEARQAGAEEKKAVMEGMAAARASAYSVGTESVDHRLRQVLVPKEDAPGGYVSMTPITASSLCPLFFDPETGLARKHNEAVKADPQGTGRRLRQAQFGIGGANPQNIGCLVRSMQRPLMVGAPGASGSVKQAFALYHKGISLDVHAPGGFRQAVLAYMAFREKKLLSAQADAAITMRERQQEERLVARIADVVLEMAAEAHDVLVRHAHLLPEETGQGGTASSGRALTSPLLRPLELRGLLDPSLRELCVNWPRQMARFVVAGMLTVNRRSGNSLLLLDQTARAGLESILEEAFR